MSEENRDAEPRSGPEPPGAFVQAWMERAGDLEPGKLFDLFQRAFVTIWERARVPLGGITLVAGLDRVLVDARARFPALGTVTVDSSGIQFARLRADADRLTAQELEDIFRFLLVEFLRLLGSLTGELITPTLQASLWSVEPGTQPATSNPRHDEGKPQGER